MPEEGFFKAGRSRPAPNIHSTRPSASAGSNGSRRASRDAEVNVTDRDVAALCWLGEQFCARADVLRVLLARLGALAGGQLAERTMRQIIERWEQSGLATRHRLLNHQWIVPTRKALHLVGLDVSYWSPVVPQLEHKHAVAIVRLALEPSIPAGGRWVSERELRREADRTNLPDGAIEWPEDSDPRPVGRGLYGEEVDRLPPRVAVEVELTRKARAKLRDALKRPRHGRYLQVDYYASAEARSYLAAQVQRIAPRIPVRVHPLPELEGVTYLEARPVLGAIRGRAR
jgi:hypothetical protein